MIFVLRLLSLSALRTIILVHCEQIVLTACRVTLRNAYRALSLNVLGAFLYLHMMQEFRCMA